MSMRDEHHEHKTEPASRVTASRELVECTRLDGLMVPSPSAITVEEWKRRLEEAEQ